MAQQERRNWLLVLVCLLIIGALLILGHSKETTTLPQIEKGPTAQKASDPFP